MDGASSPSDKREQRMALACERLESYTREAVEPNNFVKISSMDSKSITEGHKSRVDAVLAELVPRLQQVPVAGVRSSESTSLDIDKRQGGHKR